MRRHRRDAYATLDAGSEPQRVHINERAYPVPEGPNESSLARSAWKQEKSGPRQQPLPGWEAVPQLGFAQRGDIIAWELQASTQEPGDTGHVVIVGEGVITFRVNESGEPIAFQFNSRARFHTEPIAIGRLVR